MLPPFARCRQLAIHYVTQTEMISRIKLTSPSILKPQKYLFDIPPLPQTPQRNQNPYKPTQMQRQHHHTLHKRQPTREESVKQLTKRHKRNDQQCQMPALRHIIRVVQHYEPKYLLACEERNGRVADLPAETAEPANGVGEGLLQRWGREFADPVVLAAGSWGPRFLL